MDPDAVKKALAEACADLDAGRRLRRPAFALSMTLVVGMGAAPWSACTGYAAPYPDDSADPPSATEASCVDTLDDDADGLVDCDDVDDCAADPACASDAYRAP